MRINQKRINITMSEFYPDPIKVAKEVNQSYKIDGLAFIKKCLIGHLHTFHLAYDTGVDLLEIDYTAYLNTIKALEELKVEFKHRKEEIKYSYLKKFGYVPS
ncbi:MAG TPA: hypothetical protein DDX98_10455 [Bacteroidales bacterium]|jgi:hypothetical protein|nr:hypothetical protein [Bacteroidales bacterium]